MTRVEYPWHPLHGRQLPIMQRLRRGGADVLWLEERPGLCRELPAWMCDPAACLLMAPPGPPQVHIDALIRMVDLLAALAHPDGGASLRGSPRKEARNKRAERRPSPMAQLSLDLGARPLLPPAAAIPAEAVRTLADLLLEAVGAVHVAKKEVGDESENQR